MKKNKPEVLFVCPTFPAETGNGLAMRAALWLRFLAKDFTVTLLVLPISAGKGAGMREDLSKLCAHVRVVRPGFFETLVLIFRRRFFRGGAPFERFWITNSVIKQTGRIVSGNKFDLIIVHRFYLTPALRTFLRGASETCPVVLDIDDIESVTKERLAELYKKRGEHLPAARHMEQAAWYRSRERRYLPLYNMVTVCSDRDRELLRKEYGLERICVVPNSARAESLPARRPAGEKFTFMFVGNFNYFPNRDAAEFFADEILPRLRALAPSPFEVLLVGSGVPPAFRTPSPANLKVIGEVKDIALYYQSADAIIVPLRAGGGTRIKVLEAFAYERPVVSTAFGIEGIPASHEREILIADDPESFAGQCCRLIGEPALREKLVRSARALYLQNYSEQAAYARISEALSNL